MGKQYQALTVVLPGKTRKTVFIFHHYYSVFHPPSAWNTIKHGILIYLLGALFSKHPRFSYSLKPKSRFQFISSLAYF